MARRLARLAGAAVAAPVALCASQMFYARAKFVLAPDASGPLSGVAEADTPQSFFSWLRAPAARRRRNIVFMGDSIVTGVGCSAEASRDLGPILPRRVAQIVAQQLGEDVGWRALGETGADVNIMRQQLLPSLQEAAAGARDAGQSIDAVVILTGLNDIKECFLFAKPLSHHPHAFGRNLAALLGSICDAAGEPVAVLVAGTPFDAVPRFTTMWPLSVAIRWTVSVWEDQKRLACTLANIAVQSTGAAGGGSSGGGGGFGSSGGGSANAIRFIEPPPSMVRRRLEPAKDRAPLAWATRVHAPREIGRASCRERV